MDPRAPVTDLELLSEFNKGITNAKFLTRKNIAGMEAAIDSYMSSVISDIDPNDPEAAQKISDAFNKPIDGDGNTIMHYVAQNFDSLTGLRDITGPYFYGEEIGDLNTMTLNLITQYGGDLTKPNNLGQTAYSISPQIAKYTHDLFPEAIRNLETTQEMLETNLQRVDINETAKAEFDKNFVTKSDMRTTLENYKKRIPVLKALSNKLDQAMMLLSPSEPGIEVTSGKISPQYQYLTHLKQYKNKLYTRPRRDEISRKKAHLLNDFIFEVENVATNEERKAIVDRYLQNADLAQHHINPSKARRKQETRAIRLLKDYQKQLFGNVNEITPIQNQGDLTKQIISKTLHELQIAYNQKPLKSTNQALLTVNMDPHKNSLKKLATLENISRRHGNKAVLIKNGDSYHIYGLSKNNKWEVTDLDSGAVKYALAEIDNDKIRRGYPAYPIFPDEKFKHAGMSFQFDTVSGEGLVGKLLDPSGLLRDAIEQGHDPNTYRNQQAMEIQQAINKIKDISRQERAEHDPENAVMALAVVEETLAKTRENRRRLKLVGFDFLSTINADLRGMRNELRHSLERMEKFAPVPVEERKSEYAWKDEPVEPITSASQEMPSQATAKTRDEENPLLDEVRETLSDYVQNRTEVLRENSTEEKFYKDFTNALWIGNPGMMSDLLDKNLNTGMSIDKFEPVVTAARKWVGQDMTLSHEMKSPEKAAAINEESAIATPVSEQKEVAEDIPAFDEVKRNFSEYVESFSSNDNNQWKVIGDFSNAFGNDNPDNIPDALNKVLNENQDTINKMSDFQDLISDIRKIAKHGIKAGVKETPRADTSSSFFQQPKADGQLKQIDALIRECNTYKNENDSNAKFYESRSKNLTQLKNSIEKKGVTSQQIERINLIIKNTKDEITKRHEQQPENINTKKLR